MPADFEVPAIHQKPRDKRLNNLQHLGRPKGAQDKISRDLKNGIIDAAIVHGSDGEGAGGLAGYLFLLAAEHKKTFGNLLMKLLPMNLTGSVEQSLVGTVRIISAPSGIQLSTAELRRIEQGQDTIEAVVQSRQLKEPAAIEAPIEAPAPEEAPAPVTERERLVALARSQGWTPLPPRTPRADW